MFLNFYKCKECGVEKDYSEYYKHPLTKDGISHRCKDCMNKGRRSEKERIMARVRDTDRYRNNPERKRAIDSTASERRRRKGYGSIHSKAERKAKHKRPIACPICGGKGRIVFHHPDYTKPLEGVFCCCPCHSKLHQGIIDCDKYLVILSYKNKNDEAKLT